MKKKGYKGRCEKRSLLKCVGICRTYDHIQSAYADRLEADEQVKEFQCNVPLEGLDIGEFPNPFPNPCVTCPKTFLGKFLSQIRISGKSRHAQNP